MMRKWTIAFLAVLYLGLSSGFMVSWHYCMGELSSVDFGNAATEVCGKCGMKDKEGCCETHSIMVKVQDEHQLAKIILYTPVLTESVLAESPQPVTLLAQTYTTPLRYNLPPPDLYGQERYIFLSVFRI